MRSVTKVNRARVPVHALKTESWDKPRLGQKNSTVAVAETVAGPCLDGFARASTSNRPRRIFQSLTIWC